MGRPSDESADRPRRRKKSQSGNSSQLYWIIGGVIGGVAVFALLIAGVISLVSRSGKKMAAPENFVVVNSEEDVFHISLPDGWKIQSGGKKDFLWMSAEKGSASIKVTESLAGSAMADIARSGSYDPNGPDEQLPVSRVHEMRKEIVAEEYKSYREEEPVTVKIEFGKARQSTLTAGLLRGYRVTALGAMTQITVVCTCSPRDWEVLQPAFEKVIASLGPGRKR